MNERIRELADQADIVWLLEYHSKLEKFAQLIVQECAQVVSDAVDHCEPASTYADKIKQHFGVEE